jgi:hypothetical protein
MYNVGVLDHITSRVYVICHFWTPICNVLGYWRRRSVCYTCLFTTPPVVTTISVYNVLWPSDFASLSGPGSSLDLLLGSSLICVFDLCFSSVSLFYLCLYLGVSPHCFHSLSRSLLSVCLLFSVLSSSVFSLYLSPLKQSVCAWNRRHLPPAVAFPVAPVFQQFGCLGILNG